MIRYIAERLAALMLTLFIIVSASFFILRLMPGSFVSDPFMTEDVKKAIEAKYHLDKPLITQYGYFLKDFAKLDFGVSLTVRPKVPVNEVILSKIPTTLQINILSLILTVPTGIILGIIAALKKNTWIDHLISVKVIVFISIPSFIFGTVLQYLIGFKLGWVPILVSTESSLTMSKFISMILPILALSFGGIATIARYMRAELSEALNSDYMLLAKSKGLNQVQATLRHAMRNSFIPLANIIIPMFLGVLGGSMVIERIFGIPGMGNASIEAINGQDHTMTIGIMFWYSLIGLISVLIVDLSYGIIDPRVRIGGRK